MAKFIAIYVKKEIGKPAEFVARKEHRVAKAMMRDAIADFKAQGVALRIETDKRIVTEFGEELFLEHA
jgi:hypothetical protein